MKRTLENKIAVVTGGSGAIGSAIIADLEQQGACAVSLDVARPAATPFQACDVRDDGSVASAIVKVQQTYGHLDLVVHAAGVSREAVLWKLAVEDWDFVQSVNLRGAFLLLRYAIPVMRAGEGGRIVLIGSINGSRGKFGTSAYSASKAGLIALARTVAREVARLRILINVVEPGWVRTPLTDSLPQAVRDAALAESLVGKIRRTCGCGRRSHVSLRTRGAANHRADPSRRWRTVARQRLREETHMSTKSLEEPGILETDSTLVRLMNEHDLEAVVTIDAAASGRRRPRYFELMLERAVKQAALQVSLAAEVDGRVVGFAIVSLYYGEYGVSEPTASLDAISVDPANRGQQVGKALLRQLRLNLSALRVTTLRTEVSWDNFDLLAFFKKEGFSPARRLCLECALDPTR